MWQLLLGALGVYVTIWCRWRLETARWAPPRERTEAGRWRARRGRGNVDAASRGTVSPLARLTASLYWVCLTASAVLLAHGLATVLVQ